MKGFLRSVSALLLIIFFASFCLWRYEKLSLIDDVTSYFGGALDRFDRLLALAEPKGEEEQEPPSRSRQAGLLIAVVIMPIIILLPMWMPTWWRRCERAFPT